METFDLSQALTPNTSKPSALAVRFYTEPQKDDQKTKAEGRDIYRDVDMIEVRVPGESDAIRRPVREADKREWPKLWEAYSRSQSQEAVEGFPLSQWAGVTRSQAEELKFFGIRTVEQLAQIPDSALHRVGPYRAFVIKAADWLKQQQGSAEVNKLRAENDDLKSRMAALEQIVSRQAEQLAADQNARSVAAVMAPPSDDRLAKLEAQIAAMAAPRPPKRRGRPPKAKPVNGAETA